MEEKPKIEVVKLKNIYAEPAKRMVERKLRLDSLELIRQEFKDLSVRVIISIFVDNKFEILHLSDHLESGVDYFQTRVEDYSKLSSQVSPRIRMESNTSFKNTIVKYTFSDCVYQLNVVRWSNNRVF